MKTIRFIRHAESVANAGLPTTDPGAIPLTESGKLAAALAASEYDGPEPDLIVVSPYLRARQTAEPFIARFPGAEVETWPVHSSPLLVGCYRAASAKALIASNLGI